MGLVGYSDSEGSENEVQQTLEDADGRKDASFKRGFKKVVDQANPNKIRVSLPEAPSGNPTEVVDEPPVKRMKLGGGGLGGFNAMLPAPKRAGPSAPTNASTGLRKGVSLKTGAEPGFKREPMDATKEMVGEDNKYSNTIADETWNDENPLRYTEGKVTNGTDVQPKGKVTMFKPLSVARKPQKAKKKGAMSSSAEIKAKVEAEPEANAAVPKAKPRVSLFSSYTEDERSMPSNDYHGDYQPTLYKPESAKAGSDELDSNANANKANVTTPTTSQPGAQSLEDIASDLNLSASARRQLLGRGGKGAGANVMTFDTDTEYAANEAMRANQKTGEGNKPVHSIPTGKHSLLQLVNAVVGQKEALEEQFASGRRNQKESGSRYGW